MDYVFSSSISSIEDYGNVASEAICLDAIELDIDQSCGRYPQLGFQFAQGKEILLSNVAFVADKPRLLFWLLLQEHRATVVRTTTLEIPQHQAARASVVRATTTLTLTCRAAVIPLQDNVSSVCITQRGSSVRDV